jgi:alpha-galactosidase
MCSLAGGHIMVSDPVSAYDAAHLDALRRVGPTFFTRPLNAASVKPDPEYMALSAEKGGESWTVLARFAWSDLPAGSPAFSIGPGHYLAFDFWKEKFLGSVTTPRFDRLERGTCQVIALRPDLNRPQVLGTNRHLGQGVAELKDVRWVKDRLSGSFLRGSGQRWSLYLRVPKGWKVEKVDAGVSQQLDGEVLKLTFSEGSGWAKWGVQFAKS